MSGRLFSNLSEAAKEIRRDLSKSPVVKSHRVQNKSVDFIAREALNYQYSLIGAPGTIEQVVELGVSEGLFLGHDVGDLLLWANSELMARFHWSPNTVTELLHPSLKRVVEGNEPSYTYTDRLFGAIEKLGMVLLRDPESRRAYLPIFYPEDTTRASRLTRIPCSTSYWVAIRDIPGGTSALHLTYTERSCDYQRFWLWDIWFARQFQIQLLNWLEAHDMRLELGQTTHFINSFHLILDSYSGEIY